MDSSWTYIFLLFDHDSNAILVHPIKSRQAAHLIEGYNACYAKLQAAVINPLLHKLDKQVSNSMCAAITTKNLKYQLADTRDHHVNPAECGIGTFKNHSTAILSGCDSNFPPSLCCNLFAQAEITVNLLHSSCINPSFLPTTTKSLGSLTSIQIPWRLLALMPSSMNQSPNARAPLSATEFRAGTSARHLITIALTKSMFLLLGAHVLAKQFSSCLLHSQCL